MPLSTTYTVGTASVANGATAVTGTGTEWLRSLREGDYFGGHEGLLIRIASIETDEALTLAYIWPGTTLTDDPYEIIFADSASRSIAQTRDLISTMRALDVNTMGLFYTFSTTTADADPGLGALRLNHADPASATSAFLSTTDANATGRNVTGLLDLWDVGTTILIRSVETTAYASYELTASATSATGYRKLVNFEFVEGDGSFVNGEALAIIWAGVGEGLNVDAQGSLAGRDAFDDEPAGFVYLTTDGTPTIYRKNSGTTADWSDGAAIGGPAGNNGWTETHAIVSDGSRRVLQVVAYIGGTGTAPTTNLNKYLTASGYTSTIGSAVDIRGPTGITGSQGIQGDEGPSGWTPVYGVVSDDDREVLQLAGYIGGEGTEPTTNVGDYVSTSGFTSDISLASNIRGATGATGATGADGTDPGFLHTWDEDNADSDQGSGKIWADADDLTTATVLYLSKTTRSGDVIDYDAIINGSSSVDRLGYATLTRTGGNAQAVFDVTAFTDATNYVKLTVVSRSDLTGFIANDAISFQFYSAGSAGADGDGAFNGPVSSTAGNFQSFADTSGNQGADSGYNADDFAKVANNGSDFADKQATIDTLSLKGANIASDATVNLDTATGSLIHITGTATTTAITLTSGRRRRLIADGAWIITAGTNLVIKGVTSGQNYTCTAGDELDVWADGTTIRVTVHRVSGKAAVAEVTLAGSETLTNKTLTTPIITLEQGSAVLPTAEGRIAWDTDDNKLKVGDGSGTKTFSDDSVNAAAYQPLDSDLTAISGTYEVGSYTPTGTAGTNISSVTPLTTRYFRLGNLLLIFGYCAVDPTATGAAVFRLSFPFANDTGSFTQLAGLANAGGTTEVWSANGSSTTDDISFNGIAVNTASHNVHFIAAYIMS